MKNKGARHSKRNQKATAWSPDMGEEETQKKTIPPKYQMHKYLLYFLDPEVEQRYFDFQYVDNAFIPGKMFSFMWSSIIVMSFIYFTEPWYNNASYTVEAFTSLWWIGSYLGGILNLLLGVGLYINCLKPYREINHLLQLFVGWPAMVFLFLIVRKPAAYGIANVFGSFFSFLIAQPRMHRSLPVVTLWPIICLFVVTFSVPGYWDDHTYIEMLYWLATPTPVLLLSFLEQQTRRSFVDRELAMEAIKESEHKTAVTQRMIANFFPATPTRDLLQQLDGPRDQAYPDTVLIVTDIVGFTAHTSRSDPWEVIDTITSMFQSFNSTAEQYGVEKIATVGDSYCGAVFSTPTLTGTERCVNAMQFACSTLGFAGPGLQLRVGVHIGDVVGVFVGCAPPKFDLFGEGIDVAREMEEDSRPGWVHFSRSVAVVIVSYMGDFRHEPTEHGHVCEAFGTSSEPQHDEVPPMDVPFRRKSVHVSALVVKALCAFTSSTPIDGHSTDPEVDEDEEEWTGFHKFFLTFNRPKLERKYQRKLQSVGVNVHCARVLLGVTFWLFVIQLNLQCSDSRSLGISSAIMAMLLFYSNYLQFIGTDHYFHGPLTWILYNSILVLSMLGFNAGCSRHELEEVYVSNVVGAYACVATFGPQYCLDVRVAYRLLMSALTGFLWCVCVAIRRSTIQDEVGVWDAMPMCAICFAAMSFFPDFSLRSAFRTEVQLEALKRIAKSKSGHMAESAMSIMLPTFVTERIIALSRGATPDPFAYSLSQSDIFSSYSKYMDSVVEVDFNNVSATWEYNHCVIMFTKFHSDDADFTPHKIHMGVQAIEEIAKRFGVKKVKTIGSTVMLVGGIDDPRTRQEHMSSMVDAAIMVRGVVFQAMKVANLEYHVGIHSGPCFGAVIGGNGAIFDLFGDTVNTASRMMSTSQPGSIQLSPSANTLLLPGVYDVRCRPDVPIKGKGHLDLFTIEAEVQPEQLTTFENFFNGKASLPHYNSSSDRRIWSTTRSDCPITVQLHTTASTTTTTHSTPRQNGEPTRDYGMRLDGTMHANGRGSTYS